jgi:hypothetical protein
VAQRFTDKEQTQRGEQPQANDEQVSLLAGEISSLKDQNAELLQKLKQSQTQECSLKDEVKHLKAQVNLTKTNAHSSMQETIRQLHIEAKELLENRLDSEKVKYEDLKDKQIQKLNDRIKRRDMTLKQISSEQKKKESENSAEKKKVVAMDSNATQDNFYEAIVEQLESRITYTEVQKELVDAKLDLSKQEVSRQNDII